MQDEASPRPRQHFLCVTLCIAAIANALVPALYFSETRLFGQTDLRHRSLVAAVVIVEYAIAFLFLLLHANVGFASGYSVATAAIVTVGSAMLAYLIVDPSGWAWKLHFGEILVLGGLVIAVLSNAVFLAAGIRYARAIHPRLHLGGISLGIAASIALLVLYVRILS